LVCKIQGIKMHGETVKFAFLMYSNSMKMIRIDGNVLEL